MITRHLDRFQNNNETPALPDHSDLVYQGHEIVEILTSTYNAESGEVDFRSNTGEILRGTFASLIHRVGDVNEAYDLAEAFEKDIEELDEAFEMYTNLTTAQIMRNLIKSGRWTKEHTYAVHAAHVAGRMIQHRAEQAELALNQNESWVQTWW
jgi:hypothetical protein